MRAKTTIPISEARKRIFDIADEVQKPGVYYIFTDKGRPKTVIMSYDEFDSIMETLEVKRIFPDLDKDIAETEKALKTGEYKKWPTLDSLKRDWGFAVADKSSKKYGVSSRNKTKSKKKSR